MASGIFQFFVFCLLVHTITKGKEYDNLTHFSEFKNKAVPCGQYYYSCWPTSVHSLEACATTCINSDVFPCLGFMWIPSFHPQCILTNITSSLARIHFSEAPYSFYYQLSKGNFASLFHEVNVTTEIQTYTGASRKTYRHSTLDSCAKLCLEADENTCQLFHYNRNISVCNLMSSTGGIEPTSTNQSDQLIVNTIYTYKEWPCNVTFWYNYQPRVWANPHYPYAPLQSSTCEATIIAPASEQVEVYITTTGSIHQSCPKNYSDGIYIHYGADRMSKYSEHICNGATRLMFRSPGSVVRIRGVSREKQLMYKVKYSIVKSNECGASVCQNGGSCVVKSGNCFCVCAENYTGDLCNVPVRNCENIICANNGTCTDTEKDGAVCQCIREYEGFFCEKEIDPCQFQPCKFGTCISNSEINSNGNNETIFNRTNDIKSGMNGSQNYYCECFPGFTGEYCEYDINECVSSPCDFGMCYDNHDCVYSACEYGWCVLGGGLYYCQCFPGFTGHNCSEDINDCEPDPCLNGQCHDYVNGFECECRHGFTGMYCEYCVDDSNDECNKTGNLCNEAPCRFGECQSTNLGYECSCNGNGSKVICNRSEVVISSTLPNVKDRETTKTNNICFDNLTVACTCFENICNYTSDVISYVCTSTCRQNICPERNNGTMKSVSLVCMDFQCYYILNIVMSLCEDYLSFQTFFSMEESRTSTTEKSVTRMSYIYSSPSVIAEYNSRETTPISDVSFTTQTEPVVGDIGLECRNHENQVDFSNIRLYFNENCYDVRDSFVEPPIHYDYDCVFDGSVEKLVNSIKSDECRRYQISICVQNVDRKISNLIYGNFLSFRNKIMFFNISSGIEYRTNGDVEKSYLMQNISFCLILPKGTDVPSQHGKSEMYCSNASVIYICTDKLDICASSPCVNGECYQNTNHQSGSEYVCQCAEGFKGRNCEDKDDDQSTTRIQSHRWVLPVIIILIGCIFLQSAVLIYVYIRRRRKTRGKFRFSTDIYDPWVTNSRDAVNDHFNRIHTNLSEEQVRCSPGTDNTEPKIIENTSFKQTVLGVEQGKSEA